MSNDLERLIINRPSEIMNERTIYLWVANSYGPNPDSSTIDYFAGFVGLQTGIRSRDAVEI